MALYRRQSWSRSEQLDQLGRGRGRGLEAGRILIGALDRLPAPRRRAGVGATRLVMVAYRELTNRSTSRPRSSCGSWAGPRRGRGHRPDLDRGRDRRLAWQPAGSRPRRRRRRGRFASGHRVDPPRTLDHRALGRAVGRAGRGVGAVNDHRWVDVDGRAVQRPPRPGSDRPVYGGHSSSWRCETVQACSSSRSHVPGGRRSGSVVVARGRGTFGDRRTADRVTGAGSAVGDPVSEPATGRSNCRGCP